MSSVDAYRDQLIALQPPGVALPTEPDTTWSKLLRSIADEFARVDGRLSDLVDEMDPRETFELLPDWERLAGLPDDCASDGQTLAERHDALHARITSRGGQSSTYYIGLAASIGYAITITEFDPYTVVDDVDASVMGGDWAFAWQVIAPEATVRHLDAESGVDEPLADWGNEELECSIGKLKPAHTHVIYAYS